MLLFAASANVCYCIFTYANEKFKNVFVKAFTKSDGTGLHFGTHSYRLENFHATAKPDSMLFALALQIVLV